MANNFKQNIEANRKAMENKQTAQAAKKIKQYNNIDAYTLMKQGHLYAIKFEDKIIGAATTEKEAQAAIELLKHCTGGVALTSANLYSAMTKAQAIITTGDNLMEAEKEGTITIAKTYVIDDNEYIVDETGELYTIDGKLVCNIADIDTALASKALTPELYDEILKKRIAEYKKAPTPVCNTTPCNCAYNDTTSHHSETRIEITDKFVTYKELGADRDQCDDEINDAICDWLNDEYQAEIEEVDWCRHNQGVLIDATMNSVD